MAYQMDESDLLIHPINYRSRGAQASHQHPSRSRASESDKAHSALKQLSSLLPCDICIKSKAVILILAWSMIIGAIYLLLLNGFGVIGFGLQHYNEHIKHDQLHINVLIIIVILAYALLAIILLVYPLSGYFADVWCGRYKAVTISLVLLCVALLLLCGVAIIGMTKSWRVQHFELGHLVHY